MAKLKLSAKTYRTVLLAAKSFFFSAGISKMCRRLLLCNVEVMLENILRSVVSIFKNEN